ncbi:MAG: hypothetical protein ABSC06_10745 [Rhodopila sp.]|jgi:hypothetical protein
MAQTATVTSRAPRGTKVVVAAFFTAVDAIPQVQRDGVVKAALTMIRERLKDARDKAKLAKGKQTPKRAKAPEPRKAAARPEAAVKAATKKDAAPAKPPKAPEKAVAKRGKVAKAPRVKAAEPTSSPSGETITPDDKMAV